MAKPDLSGYRQTIIARVATTANVTLSSALEDGDTLNGVTLATGDVVFVWQQTTASENGLYVVKASGTPDRYHLLPSGSTADGVAVQTTEGTLYKDTIFVCTSNGTVVGSSAQTWGFPIPNVIGDSGSGGTRGLVPAPSAGDAAAVTIDAAVYPPDLTRQADGSRFSIAVDAGDLVLGFTPGGTA